MESTQAMEHTSTLCPRCASLDFHPTHIRRVENRADQVRIISELGPLDALEHPDCQLCRFFQACTRQKPHQPSANYLLTILCDHNGCILFAIFVSREEIEEFRSFLKRPALGIIMPMLGNEKSAIGEENEGSKEMVVTAEQIKASQEHNNSNNSPADGQPPEYRQAWQFRAPSHLVKVQMHHDRALAHDSVSLQAITEWLSLCEAHNHDPSMLGDGLAQWAPCAVIDCRTRVVVQHKQGAEYFALSYVWGKPREDDLPTTTATGTLGSQMSCGQVPQTIEDAIQLTLRLGYQFLWVDQYCVPTEGKARHEEILNMDSIYRHSKLTVIAAAGQNRQYGLPGIGPTHRRKQISVALPLGGLVSLPSTLDELMEHSNWSTRGWTYQEGLLAKRRLIFTDDQVFFECDAMRASEAIVDPYKHQRGKSILLGDGPRSVFIRLLHGLPVFMFDTSPHDFRDSIWLHIAEYKQRSLTYQSDTLNAFLGILKQAERWQLIETHLHGLPILHHPQEDPSSAWTNEYQPAYCICHSLLWSMGSPGTRKPQFPSWSWTGWDGELIGPIVENMGPFDIPEFEIDSCQHGRVSLLQLLTDKSRPTLRTTLHVEAMYTLIHVIHGIDQFGALEMKHETFLEGSYDPFTIVAASNISNRWYLKMAFLPGVTLLCRAQLDRQIEGTKSRECCYNGIMLTNIHVLLVETDISGRTERVGTASLVHNWLWFWCRTRSELVHHEQYYKVRNNVPRSERNYANEASLQSFFDYDGYHRDDLRHTVPRKVCFCLDTMLEDQCAGQACGWVAGMHPSYASEAKRDLFLKDFNNFVRTTYGKKGFELD